MTEPIDEVRLRTYQADDIKQVAQAVIESKAELTPWMPWCYANYGHQDAQQWVSTRAQAWQIGTEKSFAITDGEGQLLGGCGLHRLDPVNGVAEAGYWVRTSATGRGVATWALGLLIGWGFKSGGLHRIEIIASTENVASQRVAEKAKATREGVLKSRLLLEGRRHDAVMLTVMKSALS